VKTPVIKSEPINVNTVKPSYIARVLNNLERINFPTNTRKEEQKKLIKLHEEGVIDSSK
jgi:hypothetical protein